MSAIPVVQHTYLLLSDLFFPYPNIVVTYKIIERFQWMHYLSYRNLFKRLHVSFSLSVYLSCVNSTKLYSWGFFLIICESQLAIVSVLYLGSTRWNPFFFSSVICCFTVTMLSWTVIPWFLVWVLEKVQTSYIRSNFLAGVWTLIGEKWWLDYNSGGLHCCT